MGKLILKDAYLEVDGTDLSDRASAVGIPISTDDVNLDTFGGEFHEHGQGLKDGTITATFIQDLEAGSVNAVLWPLAVSGDSFSVVVRAKKASVVAANNPEWSMTAVLFDYNPLGASVGEASTTDITFQNADGTAGIAMAVA